MARKPTHEQLEQRVKEVEKGTTMGKEAQAALRSTHINLSVVFDAIQDNINVVDLGLNLTDVNEVVWRAFGLPDKDSVLGRKCSY